MYEILRQESEVISMQRKITERLALFKKIINNNNFVCSFSSLLFLFRKEKEQTLILNIYTTARNIFLFRLVPEYFIYENKNIVLQVDVMHLIFYLTQQMAQFFSLGNYCR
jgi:hypothetical protein